MADASTRRQPVLRRIYFYRMSDMPDLWHTIPFDPTLLTKDIQALRGDSRYALVNDDYGLCLIPDSCDSFRFGKVRRTDMSRVEVNGQVKSLRLGHGEKLFDCIHIVFFQDGLVGAEFNLYGPRMPTLTDYMISKLASCAPVTFDRLVYGDITERLSRVRAIKLIELKIDTSRSEVLAPFGDGWIETSKSMKEQMGVGSLEIVLRAGHTARLPLGARALSAVRDMIGKPDLRDTTERFRISAIPGDSDTPEIIDLLDDKLAASVEVPRRIYQNPDRYRELMYTEIRKAYNGLKQDLARAVRVIQ